MFSQKLSIRIFIIGIFVSILLVACDDKTDNPLEENSAPEKEDIMKEASEPTPGGSIVGAMYEPPAGMFNPIFYEDPYEANILSFTHESLVGQNEQLEFIPKLAKSWETNEDQTELTLYLEEEVKWHDGEEFTADDVVFTYQSIADPDYTEAGGVHTAFVEPLLGYSEYVNGDTDQFQGVIADDTYTVTFKFKEPMINPLYIASFPVIPEHIFKEIPIADMPSAEASINPEKVIGTGPFKFAKAVEGEEYILERHDAYWQGTPYLDEIIWRVVAKSVIAGLLERGEVDIIANPDVISANDYETVRDLENITLVEQPDFSYQILGFKLHHQTKEDVENGIINPTNWKPNPKLSEPQVRQAIAYAINREQLIMELLNGRGQLLHSPIAQSFWAYDESATEHYSFDPEEAKALLDELGYVDTNEDGFREDPDGNEWVLHFDYPTGNAIREETGPLIAQMLEEIGIKIELREPKEMFTFIQDLTNDNNDWDLYLLGWNLSSTEPDPANLWLSTAAYNFSRWNNPDSDDLLNKAIKTPEAFEQDYRLDVYHDWQKLYSEELPALILYTPNNVWAYNNRLKGIEPLPYTLYNNTHQWWVVEKK
ncbi:ABC transporter substrate-binding protein [Ornithinibacillus sp. FSL M8-0202]|uniref:ABC transporter substrate-binding protein n=1 Tax=Ornithinibacillus sp. FSL M8-0202 TaxID=2921616 RepID=UPI0030D29FBC